MGLPCSPPRDPPHPGIEPASHVSCIGRWFFITSAAWEAPTMRASRTAQGTPVGSPWRPKREGNPEQRDMCVRRAVHFAVLRKLTQHCKATAPQ